VSPTIRVLGRTLPAFQLCGTIGWIAGISLALALTAHQGLPLWGTGVLAVGALVTFPALVMAVKIVTGEENIVYYHHEIAVVAVSMLTLWLLSLPLLPYLDAVFMGLGLFLACGRIGCFLVGCCHGRPSSWGVCYGADHAHAGFAPELVGVRLVPIQLVEAVFVAATVTVGTVMVLRDAVPGSALAFYSIVYGVARCVFEIFRGDDVRPYWRGGSEAQWTSLIVMAVVLGLSQRWPVPFGAWLLVTTLGLGVVLLGSALTDGPRRHLFSPRHVSELARLLELTHANVEATGRLQVARTSLGLRVSASTIHDGQRWLDVFAVSKENDRLDDRTARKLARLIARLRRAVAEGVVTRGAHGVYHVIVPATAPVQALAHAV